MNDEAEVVEHDDRQMHFHYPATGQHLLTYREEHVVRREEAAAHRAAEARAEQEVEARQAAEARVAELEALLCGVRR